MSGWRLTSGLHATHSDRPVEQVGVVRVGQYDHKQAMNDFPAITIVVAALFSLMAFRAFRSASTMDYLLGATQCVGLLLLLSNYREFASYLLLLTAVAYLVSQVLTGARPLSRLLPLAGAAAVVLSLLR